MALRSPLVIINGQVQNLPAADTLDAPQSGGDVIVLTNDEVGSTVIGTPVYMDAASGFKKARANAAGTKNVIGLQRDTSITAAASGSVQTNGVLHATTGQWDTVTGGSGGLTFNTKYWLDPSTAGMITSTAPSTGGQYVAPIGIALSTTDLKIEIEETILL